MAIIKALRDLEIDNIDKIEIMLNVTKFLDDKNYEENLKTLIIKDKKLKNNHRRII